MVNPTNNTQEAAVETRPLTAAEMIANRNSYIPSPLAVEYDGPMDDGEPQPSCYRKWQKSRQGIFAKEDLRVLERANDLPVEFEKAVETLVDMVKAAPRFDNKNPLYGRFEFCTGPSAAKDLRAAFRMLRASLDFLEADFLDCEAEELEYMRGKLADYQEIRERGY